MDSSWIIIDINFLLVFLKTPMYQKIKNIFHKEENEVINFKKMNEQTLRYIFGTLIVIEIISFLLPTITVLNTNKGTATVLPAVLSALTNEKRVEEELSTLSENDLLNKAASMKAMDMAQGGYFAHTSPEGKTPWYWLDRVGYKYRYAGENLAINFSESRDITDAWMASSTHKENIINENYTEVGTGVALGDYEGKKAVFIVQVYANPISSSVLVSEIKKKLSEVTHLEANSQVDIRAERQTSTKEENYKNVIWKKVFSNSEKNINTVLLVFSGLLLFAIFVYIIGKIRNQKKGLITNTLIATSIIGAIFSFNFYFKNYNTIVSQSYHYLNPKL